MTQLFKKNALKSLPIALLMGFLVLAGSSMTSCSPKSGCKMTEDMGPPTDKDGQLSRKRGKTKLFKD